MSESLESGYRRMAQVLSDTWMKFKERSQAPLRCLPHSENGRRIWFHAASAGELEILWPVVEECFASGWEAVVTGFSPSAQPSLGRLSKSFMPSGRLIEAGLSPLEGHWSAAIERVKPDMFVTAKYEAWPELWMSLARKKIPCVILNASFRPSLRVAAQVCRVLGSSLPPLYFSASNQSEAQRLTESFPESVVTQEGDPRWDRIASRYLRISSRAKILLTKANNQPRPWGVIGSAWARDLEMVIPLLKEIGGTLWVAPHEITQRTKDEVLRNCNATGLAVAFSSDDFATLSAGEASRVLCVDEQGVLAELYSACDWAWVGGGFQQGTHSTMEPAWAGIPIACGPRGLERFAEVPALEETGQLTVIRSHTEARKWAAGLPSALTHKERWVEANRSKAGASSRVVKLLELVRSHVSVE